MRRSPGAEEKLLAAIAESGPHARNIDLQQRTGYAPSTVRNTLLMLTALGCVQVIGRGRWRRIEPTSTPIPPTSTKPPGHRCDLADRRKPRAEIGGSRMSPAMRRCLGCQTDFPSSWCGERLCESCRKRTAVDA